MYTPQLFNPTTYTFFTSKKGTDDINDRIRKAVDRHYYDVADRPFSGVTSGEWSDMRDVVLAEYPWFAHFDGAWGLRWLMSRTWTCRTRNRHAKAKSKTTFPYANATVTLLYLHFIRGRPLRANSTRRHGYQPAIQTRNSYT